MLEPIEDPILPCSTPAQDRIHNWLRQSVTATAPEDSPGRAEGGEEEEGEEEEEEEGEEGVNRAGEPSHDGDGSECDLEGGPSDPQPYSTKLRDTALVLTVTGASFLNTLSSQAVVIILPSIGRDLNIPAARLQWVVSAYALTFSTFLLLWGRIGDIFGKRRIFIWGSFFVTVTLFINPFLHNEMAFDVIRALQGLGAAANVPTAVGILGATFPHGKAKNSAMSIYASGAPLGSIFGTLIAGFIASVISWKWVFVVLGFLAALITIAGLAFIPSPPESSGPTENKIALLKSVDWLGGFLVTAGLLALLFALVEGNVLGWGTHWIPFLIVIAIILLTVFYAWQWYQENHTSRIPLIRLSIFQKDRLCASLVILGLLFACFNNLLVYATFFYQNYQGLDPMQTTWRFIPTGVAGILTVLVVKRQIPRMPLWIPLVCGTISTSIASLLFAVPLPRSASYFAFGLPAFILSVVGVDTVTPCLVLYTLQSLPHEDQALGGGLVNASAGVGRAIGLAIATAIQMAVLARARGTSVKDDGELTQWDAASIMSIRAANWFSFVLGVLSVGIVALKFRGVGILGESKKPRVPRDTPSAPCLYSGANRGQMA
ncbi:major facilitator superfamily-domain-containing protein [Xylaria sp. CBS 124048]|nr:major facilitator superfamily-domain-containing protein [Xylaria sp. CBS 124048]